MSMITNQRALICSVFLGLASLAVAQEDGTFFQGGDANEVAVDVEYGMKRPVLDTAGWIVGIPRKIMLWDHRVDNHDVTDETVDAVADYIGSQQIDDVKVRVNQYDPLGEWRRLVSNKRIGPGWRYTLGTLHQIRYTFLPGRLFGRDEYNPYTNTVSIYSDVPAIGMVESAYAKDVQQRELPGTYAAVQSLPVASLWHETRATDDVVRYVSVYGTPEEIAKTRKLLYARYGAEVGGELGDIVSGAGNLEWIGAGAGHLTAYQRNLKLRR